MPDLEDGLQGEEEAVWEAAGVGVRCGYRVVADVEM